jgi:hypothetical protein
MDTPNSAVIISDGPSQYWVPFGNESLDFILCDLLIR